MNQKKITELVEQLEKELEGLGSEDEVILNVAHKHNRGNDKVTFNNETRFDSIEFINKKTTLIYPGKKDE